MLSQLAYKSSRHVLLGGIMGALLISGGQPARAQMAAAVPAPPVLVDNRQINFGATGPVQRGGRLLVPLREVFEALGATVEFIPANMQIRARRESTLLILNIGSSTAYVNSQPRLLDVPAQVEGGRTLVPLRFVAEAFGAQVKINPITQAIEISSPPAATGGTGLPYSPPGVGQSYNGTLVKVDSTPPTTITATINGNLQVFPLANNCLILRQLSIAKDAASTPIRQPVRAVTLANLSSGDPVRITVNEQNQAVQILAAATVIIAKVQFAGGNQIILDDERDTALTIGPNLRYIDPQGRASASASLQAGQSVGLFVSRLNNTIYQVSAYVPDIIIGSGAQDPLPNGQMPPVNTPQVQVVQHDAVTSLRAGGKLRVIVRGTPGVRASFSLGPKIVNLPLPEDPAHPGAYGGEYTVRAGDDVLNARITGKLSNGNLEDTKQSEQPVTVDTVAPRILGTFPANGAQINTAVPNLTIFTDDLGGSGLAGATLDAIANNTTGVRLNATVAPPNAINIVPPQALTGAVTIRGNVVDAAGNLTPVEWTFTVIQGTNVITSFAHGANRAVQAGEEIPLLLIATPAGRASFDVLNGRGTVQARDLPLVETQPGRYRGSYKVPANPPAVLRFLGKFVGTDNVAGQLEATTRVEVVAAQVPTNLTVDAPADEERVNAPIVVKGKAAPGATVDISVRAEGTQFFILDYREDLGTQQVRADGAGNWATKAIDLPVRRNVADLHYVITVRQTDAANRQSDPVTVTVRNR